MSEGKKKYEISFLARSEKGKEPVMAALNEIGAEITIDGKYSEMKLAYEIEKQPSAYFGFVEFMADPDKIDPLQKTLKFNSEILRVLVITPPAKKPLARNDRRSEENTAAERASSEEKKIAETTEEALETAEEILPTETKETVQDSPEKVVDKKEEISDELLDQKLDEILK
ncbi:MAG: 30S ribosomal protein S6 [Candidatus Colwellbacteria bacterium]|nr:30S ribosomal protein S6 [Candidatus Colwellbacteria bacterium]